MLPGQELHLDHNDQRTGWIGFSHKACNLRAAAAKHAAFSSTANAPSQYTAGETPAFP
jgi:hypothetical protein